MKRYFLLVVALLVSAVSAQAQRVATGLTVDTVRVGDPFRAIARIGVEPGEDVALPDSLQNVEDLENAGRVRTRRDSTAQGVNVIAAFPLIAWRPGSIALPSFDVTLRSGGRERRVTVDLPAVTVVSVLPADTTNIQAKPPKDVFGPNRLWWPWILAALLLLAALAAAYWWWRRRRKQPDVIAIPMPMPRERALQELTRIQQLGLIEQGEYKRFYTMLSGVLRQYLESFDSKWSGDLTTEELAQRVKQERDVAPAIAVLRTSDLVKFARETPNQRDAKADWQKAYDWLAAFRVPPATELEAA